MLLKLGNVHVWLENINCITLQSSNLITPFQVVYPGNSGYAAETGGYLANLRNSTNITKVI